MKKIVSVFLSAVMLSSMVFAAPNITEDVNGDMTYEEGASYYVPTPEDEAIRQFILSQPQAIGNVYYRVVSVTPFLQENSYYCGPATVKQTLHSVNGSSSSQSSYASRLGTTTSGTDMTKIPAVLNSDQNETYYVYSTFSDINTWLSYSKWSLNKGVPAILDINTSGISQFPYTSSGHFVNLSGLDLDENDGGGTTNRALITDPYGPGFGNNWYYVTNVYQANRNHFRSAIIH